ncbi:MAG: hypothetical protein J6S67_08640, partial [Methanobrevibacter sp.]|nr:hypothetical protein [Methanobrevibacter sp.]
MSPDYKPIIIYGWVSKGIVVRKSPTRKSVWVQVPQVAPTGESGNNSNLFGGYMKKFFAFIIALIMVLCLAACKPTEEKKELSLETIKIGLICLHDENSTY